MIIKNKNILSAINSEQDTKLSITSNYSDMSIIKINVIVEEILGDIKQV